MSNQVSAEVLASAQNPQATQHSNTLGQVLATVLLGLKDGMTALGNPTTAVLDIADFISGFTKIWFSTQVSTQPSTPAQGQPPTGPTPSPAPTNPSGTTQIPA